MLVAHLFAGAAARQVPALDLPALDGLQLASQLRMRTLGAFAILADASEASFVALAEQVARHAPRADSLPWIPLYLGESERLDAQPIGKAVKDAAAATDAVAPPRERRRAAGKRNLAAAQTRRVRSKRAAAADSVAETTPSNTATSDPASTASPTTTGT